MKKTLVFIGLVFLFFSCEERMVMIPEFTPPETDKVVLIEEFSGVSCSNCPAGSAEIENIHDQFGENVVSVTYYTDILGSPRPTSKYDFRTDESRNLESYLGQLFAKPASSIDRLPTDDGLFNYRRSQWYGVVDAQLQAYSLIEMSGELNYDSTAQKVEFAVHIKPKNDIAGDYALTVLATESHIIDAQLFPGGEEHDDYEHNHVFRKFLSSLPGDDLTQNLVDGVEQTYSFELILDGEWNPNNMDIIAFVHKKESGKTGEVLQAMELHVTN